LAWTEQINEQRLLQHCLYAKGTGDTKGDGGALPNRRSLLHTTCYPEKVQLSHEALRFIARRNGFYLATTSETGWPYVQYKGGPRGFLLPLSDYSLAYPDFSGNQQYISTGNFSANAKAAVIFTDYAQRQRLKLFATVEVRPPETEADLLRAFARFNYPSNIERIIVLHVVGFNWNCPSHIYPD
jgi:uncharacterized protein